MTDLILIAVGVLLTAGTAVFVAAEFSLVALDRHTVERAVESGDTKSVGVLKSLRNLSSQLSGTQVGITITTLLFGFAVQEPLANVLTPALEALGLAGAASTAISTGLAMVIAYAFSMVCGELIPKNLAIAVPMPTARVVAPILRGFSLIFKPLIAVFDGSANGILRLLGFEPQDELSAARSPGELESLVRRSAQAGTLDAGTATLLSRTLHLSERTAADTMTHRGAMDALKRENTAQDVIDLARETGHSKFPVMVEDADDLIGVVQVRQAVAVPRADRGSTSIAKIMNEVLQVPDSLQLIPLMLQLRDQGSQMAVVRDEYGGTAGIVTLEDVIEEIVGEVSDEHDPDEPELAAEPDGSWIIAGLRRPDEVQRDTGIELPESNDYETLGGLIMDRLGRMPEVGDEVELPNARLTVIAMDERRIDQVRVLELEAPDEDETNQDEEGGK